MNADELERSIRATLQENVQDISGASLTPPALRATVDQRRSTSRGWLAPALAAAAVLIIAGVFAGLLATSGKGHTGNATMSASGGPLTGLWQLVSATTGGHPIRLDSTKVVQLSFTSSDTILANDGVNTATLTGQAKDGSLRAQFRSTTYVLDPRSSDPEGQALLHLLDSLAPSSTPDAVAHSSYQIANGQLSIRTSTGQLQLQQVASDPDSRQDGPGPVSSTPSLNRPS
jgi:hypothetical protein